MSKTPKYASAIEDYINGLIGETVSPSDMVEAIGCTSPTVYAFIKTNPNRFEKVSAGKYRILSAGSNTQTLSADLD